MRKNGRKPDELREIKITKHYISHPEGSVLVEFGNTKVICNATVENTVPRFLKGKNMGWVTAEYGMLPRSTNERMRREAKNRQSGRTMEIQRLIGRSLRTVIDLEKLAKGQFIVDCDVLQADGGTRTTSITGAFVALALAVKKLLKEKIIFDNPIKDYLAAISCGIVNKKILIDLDYNEDSSADVDANFVFTKKSGISEVQISGENASFELDSVNRMINLSYESINKVFSLQKKIIGKL